MLIHRKYVFLTLLLLTTMKTKLSYQCILPNGCKLKTFELNRYFFCDRIDAKFEMGFKQSQLNQCMLPEELYFAFLKIHMKTSRRIILDDSFDFEGLYRLYEETNAELKKMFSLQIILSELKGFDISSFNRDIEIKSKRQKSPARIYISIYDSSFEFYFRNKRIKSCEDYTKTIESSEIRGENIFQAFSFIMLKRVDFSAPICPLAFNNSYIKILTINGFMNTFYRTNTLRFLESNRNITSFFEEVTFLDVNKINLDKNLVKPDVFKNMKHFIPFGLLESIQDDLFIPVNFPQIKILSLGLQFFRPLFHRRGINWIKGLNKGLNYNIKSKNLTLVDVSSKMIQLQLLKETFSSKFEIFPDRNKNEYFPDEDFCLYLHFPFHQLVFIIFDYSLKPLENFTCTLTWLLQYHEKVAPSQYNINNIRETFEKCNFAEFIIKCNKTNFKIKKINDNIFSTIDVMVTLEFISIILVPIVCFLGFIGNIIVIIVIIKQKLKENQYIYMWLKALFNCFILFIKMLSMMNECQPNGIFCSDVRKLIGIQYTKIIFSDFFSSYFRFVSNMLHIAFLFNRLSLVGNDHTKFTEYMSKLRPRSFLIFSLIIGFFISFAKGFRLRANFNDFDKDYPFNYFDFNVVKLLDGDDFQRAIAILNCICDLINGIFFFLFCLVIDIQLLIVLKRTIGEKLAKLDMIKTNTESTAASLKNAVFRANIMVILNSMSNLLLKTPITVLAIFELVRFFNGYISFTLSDNILNDLFSFNYLNNFFFIKLEVLNIRSAFEHLAECLFLISIGFDILFYYNFDTIFKEAFSIVFFSSISLK